MESALSFTASERLRAPASPKREIPTVPELALLKKAPSTREEMRAYQVVLVGIVASELAKGCPRHLEENLKFALRMARECPRGIWPKAEFLANLDSELFFRAVPIFEALESLRAVA